MNGESAHTKSDYGNGVCKQENAILSMQSAILSFTTTFKTLSSSMDKLLLIVDGNGRPGLKTEVAVLTESVNNLKGTVDTLKEEIDQRFNALGADRRQWPSIVTAVIAVGALLVSLAV